MRKRRIAILGSTGSIGRQALDVVARHPELFEVVALSAHSQAELLFDQVRAHRPRLAGLSAGEVPLPVDVRGSQWFFGPEALSQIAGLADCDDVLVSVVGMVGLAGVLAARQAGRRVLLANKEALVAGGHLVMSLCPPSADDPTLIPVDSEHSAIYQCLMAAAHNPYERIILTASGGPFRDFTSKQLREVQPQDALRHPNWQMGPKITVDSASMFNKALELIEAKWLFDAGTDQLEVLIHPQSIVHSMVAFADGAVLAQLGLPDMRAPIAFAMAYPKRIVSGTAPLRLDQLGTLQFEAPDTERFPALRLAVQALRAGGAASCVLNAANEVAVDAFLKRRIRFTDIAAVVEDSLQGLGALPADSLEAVMEADRLARDRAGRQITRITLEDT